MPSGTLIDILWDDRPPPTAPKILQNRVSHLRKQLGDGRLETRDPGSVWIADVEEVVFRASKADLHQTGHVGLGVIPGAVTFAFGSPWLALPATFGQRITLAELDPQTVQVLYSTPIGPSEGYPPTMELTSGAGDIWVTSFDAGTLVRVDPRRGIVKATIHIGHHPFGVAFGDGRVWVTVS